MGVGWIIHLILLKCWLSTFVFHMFYYYFFNQSLQSFTLRSDSKSPGCSQKSCSRSAAPTPPKRRNSVLWSETLDTNTKESLSTKEIKRQEVTAHGKLDWEQQPRPFVPSLAGKGGTTFRRGAASSCAPKPQIYVCINHGKRWIPLWNSSPQRDPRGTPNFSTASLKSRPRWLLLSCPKLQVPAVCLFS